MNENRRGDWIQTYTGRQFWPLSPRPEDFDIADIAHALAMKCRYNGHCGQFYSVAQHSVFVARECHKRWPDKPWLAKWGLLHDLAEAYLPDIPRPIKRMNVGILAECERLIMLAAVQAFGLYPATEPTLIKAVDSALLATEAKQLMGRPPTDWCLPEPPIDLDIHPWSPGRAERKFRLAYIKYGPTPPPVNVRPVEGEVKGLCPQNDVICTHHADVSKTGTRKEE